MILLTVLEKNGFLLFLIFLSQWIDTFHVFGTEMTNAVWYSTELHFNFFFLISAHEFASDLSSQCAEVKIIRVIFEAVFRCLMFFVLSFGKILNLIVLLLQICKLDLFARKYHWLFVLELLVCTRNQLF